MSARGYPELAAHRLAHQAFVAGLVQRREAESLRRSPASLLLELSEWLDAWLDEHLRRVDPRMVAWLRDHPGP
jgi:hemerythrin